MASITKVWTSDGLPSDNSIDERNTKDMMQSKEGALAQKNKSSHTVILYCMCSLAGKREATNMAVLRQAASSGTNALHRASMLSWAPLEMISDKQVGTTHELPTLRLLWGPFAGLM